jgi:hypothetical protein
MYATRPLVESEPGRPQSVCSRRRKARSSTGNLPTASFGRSLYRWHRHQAAAPRVPNRASRSSQLASLAGDDLVPSRHRERAYPAGSDGRADARTRTGDPFITRCSRHLRPVSAFLGSCGFWRICARRISVGLGGLCCPRVARARQALWCSTGARGRVPTQFRVTRPGSRRVPAFGSAFAVHCRRC